MFANDLEINIERLWADLDSSAQIGRGKTTGLCRLALSNEDKAMRDAFVCWCRDAGCAIRVDSFGNIFARRSGTEDGLPAVLIGSHLDTQIAGGRYDGILGVLSGLEIIRTLNDRGLKTRRPIEIPLSRKVLVDSLMPEMVWCLMPGSGRAMGRVLPAYRVD